MKHVQQIACSQTRDCIKCKQTWSTFSFFPYQYTIRCTRHIDIIRMGIKFTRVLAHSGRSVRIRGYIVHKQEGLFVLFVILACSTPAVVVVFLSGGFQSVCARVCVCVCVCVCARARARTCSSGVLSGFWFAWVGCRYCFSFFRDRKAVCT